MCRTFRCLLICLAVMASQAGLLATADDVKPADLTAEQILTRMVKAYAGCTSYRDSGVVKTLFLRDGGVRLTEKPFTTAFVRPDRFRFEYTDNERRYVISCNGPVVMTWWDVRPGIEVQESLRQAIAGATGVSGGSASRIPALLMPQKLGGWGGIHIRDAKRVDDGKLEDDICFRIEGTRAGSPMTLWIDQKTYLVRQVDEQRKLERFRTETTTTYDPAVNKEISDELLAFDPPISE